MASSINLTRFTLSFALVVPAIALVSLLAMPHTFTTFSALLVAALSAAVASVAIVTYKNAQADPTVAQLLHDVDVAASPDSAAVQAAIPQTRSRAR
jgi:hypothetical protein